MQLLKQCFRCQCRFVIQVLQNQILQIADTLYLVCQKLFVEQLTDLETNLGIFISNRTVQYRTL